MTKVIVTKTYIRVQCELKHKVKMADPVQGV